MNLEMLGLNNHTNILFFTGAGISTLSGLPDFTKPHYVFDSNYLPRDILTHQFFNSKRHKELFWKYCDSLHDKIKNVHPSAVHQAINQISQTKNVQIITQNIDGLHGQNNVIEIHGNLHYSQCIKCGNKFPYTEMIPTKNNRNRMSPCCRCQAKPTIVLYNETFARSNIDAYEKAFNDATLCIVMGSSLNIPTHQDHIIRFKGEIALINNTPIKLNSYAGQREWDYTYIGNIQDVM